MDSQEPWNLENGGTNGADMKGLDKEASFADRRAPHNTSASSVLRKKSDPMLVPAKVRFLVFRQVFANLQEVILGTKLAILFPAIPLAVVADFYKFGRVSAMFMKMVVNH